MNLAFIPSPSDGVWHLGPLPLRAYALAIILGIVVAIWVGERRFVARGGRAGQVSDIAVWAIPFGLVGARIYHVATNPEFYFGDGKDPIQALYVWEGGLGIWGAIAFGALGAYLGCRFAGVRFTSFLDAVAPGVVLAQAIGRWGNYFNQELFGKPTDQPWGLEIDLDNRPEAYLEYSTFHPTFLYESLLCVAVAIIIVVADRRFQLGRGRVFALYVALYTAGRAYIEDLRIDDAHEFVGLRLNIWVAVGLFVLAVAYFIIVGRRWPGREESVYREGREPAAGGTEPDAEAEQAEGDGGSEPEGEEDAKSEDKDKEGSEDKDESEDEAKADESDDDVKVGAEKAADADATPDAEKADADATPDAEKADADATPDAEKADADATPDAEKADDDSKQRRVTATDSARSDPGERSSASDDKTSAGRPSTSASSKAPDASSSSSGSSSTRSSSSASDSLYDSSDSSPSDNW